MAVARSYREDLNDPNEPAFFPGVPLADVLEEEWALVPPWQQASVDASPLYQSTMPVARRKARGTKRNHDQAAPDDEPDTETDEPDETDEGRLETPADEGGQR